MGCQPKTKKPDKPKLQSLSSARSESLSSDQEDRNILTFSYNKEFSAKILSYRGQPNYLKRNRDSAWVAKNIPRKTSPTLSESEENTPVKPKPARLEPKPSRLVQEKSIALYLGYSTNQVAHNLDTNRLNL